MKTFPEAADFLVSLNNLPSKENIKNRRECGIYLRRLQTLLNTLKNPERKISHYLHVTGTSGKGSTCIYLSNILQEARPRENIGLLLSPHISKITERWSINNQPMSDHDFIKTANQFKKIFPQFLENTIHGSVSQLELMTAIGMKYFSDNHARWAVIEVGCGGQYDSTNILPHKDLVIITNVRLDHVPLLGKTKPQIASEKSGIISPGTTVFTGEKDRRVLRVIQKECQNKKAHLNIIDVTNYQLIKHDFSGINFIFENQKYHLNTLGIHQIHNAILTIKAAEYFEIPYQKIRTGLSVARLPLRMEVISLRPTIILDGAHNPDKIAATISTLKILKRDKGNLHLVIGFSANKDLDKIIKSLVATKPKTIAATRFSKNIFRKCANPTDIAKAFKKLLPKTKIQVFLDPIEAFQWSQKQAKKNDSTLVTGSIFLGGEIRAELTKGQN